jgi:hypothetical protein
VGTVVGERRKFVKVISSGLWAVNQHMKEATNLLLDFGFIAVTDTHERGMCSFVWITLSDSLFNDAVSS